MLERVAVARTLSSITAVSLPGMSVVFREGKSLTFREFRLGQHAATQITKLRRFSPAVQPHPSNTTYIMHILHILYVVYV